MEKNISKYKISNFIVQEYIRAVNDLKISMNVIKKKISEVIKKYDNANVQNSLLKQEREDLNYSTAVYLKSILVMYSEVKKLVDCYPKDKETIYLTIIRQIMSSNNGVICTRMLEPLNISRQYISVLEKNHEIEKISRGIYISKDSFIDSFYSFQLKYRKAIFSHMNALYFHGMTEEIPYEFTVTVPNSYHTDTVNEKCNVFYVDDDTLELGVCDVMTPNGNLVKAYDLERCICDIVRSRNRMDFEQVKKTLRMYAKSKKKNLYNLSKYAKALHIESEVMEMVGMYFE